MFAVSEVQYLRITFHSALFQSLQNHFNHCCNSLGECDVTTEIFHAAQAVCGNQQEWFILETVYVRSNDDQES